jgi:hypothetical protein
MCSLRNDPPPPEIRGHLPARVRALLDFLAETVRIG